MSNTSELPQAPSTSEEPKTLTGSSQKATQPDAPPDGMEHTDTKAAGVKAGTNVIRVIQTEQGKPVVPPLRGRRCRKARCRGSG